MLRRGDVIVVGAGAAGWWTTMPDKFPIIVGWSPAHCAEKLAGQSRSVVIERGLKTRSRLLGVEPVRLAELPGCCLLPRLAGRSIFARSLQLRSSGIGWRAGSFGKAPEQQGEATDTTAHNGTVHGAISSGRRAAKEILKGLD
jgi:hypothetical protein